MTTHLIPEDTRSEAANHARVFPLSLAPIDWIFYRDDCSQYPMVFYVDLDFTGRLDRDRFQVAIEDAIRRHPLMYAVVRPDKRRGRKNRPVWELKPDWTPSVDWDREGVPLNFEGGDAIDIANVPGLRVWVRESETAARVSLQFHHATCDGTGAYRFIGDLLACYIRQMPAHADDVELGEFDAKQLRLRPSKMRSLLSGAGFMETMKCGLVQGWRTFGSRITRLRRPAKEPERLVLPGLVTHEFTGADQKKLRNVATEMGVTMNDLLICKLFQAVGVWNGKMPGGKKIRILVPSDMRGSDDFEIPACNMTAYTFVTHQVAELADEEKLLAAIRQDTLMIKHGNLQQQFIDGLTSAMANPGVLPFMMRQNLCLATCILSNAGDPSRRFTCRLPKKRGKISCDDFTLEAITGVPPLRRNTHSTLSVSSYGRKMIFSMRCDPHFFSPEDTRSLLNTFCDQLSPLLDEPN